MRKLTVYRPVLLSSFLVSVSRAVLTVNPNAVPHDMFLSRNCLCIH